MENRSHALMAGIFTLALVIALILSVWWLSGRREETRDILLVAGSSISGLNTQAQVRFRGLRVGKVQDIAIDPRPPYRILVRVSIATSVPITTHTTAQLNLQGVTGLAFVQLDDDGAGVPLEKGRDLPRLELKASIVDSLGAAATDMAAQIRLLAGRLNRVLDDANVGRIEHILGHLEEASQGMALTLREAPRLIADVHRLLDDENLGHLSATLANLERASTDAPALVSDARRALDGLALAGRRIDALGQDLGGELGQSSLPRLDRLLKDLAANSRQLSRVLEQLERSPESLVFGREGPAPGPGEPGFRREAQ